MTILKSNNSCNLFKDEDGFTTLSVVLSLLLSITLIFSTAQVYRIISASSEVQNVADASSLSAENQVAEFMILVRVTDSIVLSLGLASATTAALAVVAMCTPFTFEFSDTLLDASKKLLDARNNFADKSSQTLNVLQKSLPFLSAIKAYETAKSNNGGIMEANYLSIAILMPYVGVEITPGNINEVKNTVDDIQNKSDDIKQAASEAEEASKKCKESKVRAFMADCGNNPNYCMFERAKNKAYLIDSQNPLYNSVDTWSFEVPLKRSKAYYPKRSEIETPEDSSIKSKSDSALRKIFYDWATAQMSEGHVIDDGDVFDAYFPHLPKNTDEMKQTSMYSQASFPVSADGIIHATSECSGCGSVIGFGSLQELDSGVYSHCAICDLSASSLGKVTQASTAIDNGYEYHYAIVEDAAKEYKAARDKAGPSSKKVKDFASNIFAKIKELISQIANKRIYAKPPGAYGVICLTINTTTSSASKGFESSFVHDSSQLGVRAAISGATLIEENTDEGNTLISSLMDGLKENVSGVSGILQIALDLWSNLLLVYSNGQNGFIDSIELALNQIPLISESGLGTWAAKSLSNFFADIGLEPANIKALKPVLVNTYNIAKFEEEHCEIEGDNLAKGFASKFIVIRQNARDFDNVSSSILTGLSNEVELSKLLNLEDAIYKDGEIELATITPFGDFGPSIPIKIKLPTCAKEQVSNILNWICLAIQGASKEIWGGKVWR